MMNIFFTSKSILSPFGTPPFCSPVTDALPITWLSVHFLEVLHKWSLLFSGLFYSGELFRVSFMLLYINSSFLFSVKLNSTSFYGCTIVCAFIHLLTNIFVISSLGPLKVKLLWEFMYKSLYEHMFSFSSVNT